MTIARKVLDILEKLSFEGFNDKDLVTEYKGVNIYKWKDEDAPRGYVYVAVTTKDGEPAYVDELGLKIKASGLFHSSGWDLVSFKSEDEAKKAIDKLKA